MHPFWSYPEIRPFAVPTHADASTGANLILSQLAAVVQLAHFLTWDTDIICFNTAN